MGSVIAGMASSHAFALRDTADWDDGRLRNRQMYERKYGLLPPQQPQIAEESDDDIRARHAHIKEGFAFIRDQLAQIKPDTLILIGDDQNENFTSANLPQIAIYIGDDFIAGSRDGKEGVRYRSDPQLAEGLLNGCVEADIDMASVRSFPNNLLFAHAFGPILREVDPEARLPVVPIFVNAIHVPAPTPRRCYYLGETLRRCIEADPSLGRVAIYASGGLSHFTGGYPWEHYQGPHTHGSISEEFDRWSLGKLAAGEGHAMAEITNQQIIENGEIEFRSWITMLGAIGDVRPDFLAYEPLYRGLMGMGIGYWSVEDAAVPAGAGRS